MTVARIFTDASGEAWKATEEGASGPSGVIDPDGTWVPYRDNPPELWFTSSSGERRMLRDFPRDWRELTDEALANLCAKASVVERGEGEAG